MFCPRVATAACFLLVVAHTASALLVPAPPLPATWAVVTAPARNTSTITGIVALAHTGADELAARVLAVSDPTSGEYGRHLTTTEVASIAVPAAGARDAVLAWLQGHGLAATFRPADGAVVFSGPADKVASAFSTSFTRYPPSYPLPPPPPAHLPFPSGRRVAAVFERRDN